MAKRSMVVPGEPERVTSNGRRYFSKAHQDAVIAKCVAPGASLAAVALANGLNANLVLKWVRQRQARQALAKLGTKLLPVIIEQDSAQGPAANAISKPGRCADCGSMQIRIGGVELVVRGAVDREQLSVVLDVLLRSR